MTQSVKYESVTGSAWIETLGTVKAETIRWVQAAHLGEVGSGSFTVVDVDGTAGHASDGIVGLKTIRCVQTAAPAGNQYIFTGYVADRLDRRGDETGIYPLAREIDVSCEDINAALGLWAFMGTDGKRPRESIGARITWLLASGYLDAVDNGLVVYPTTPMLDATNYATRYPGDVLADCVTNNGFNYFLRWNSSILGIELAFYESNTSPLDSTTARVSNAGDDNGSTIFAPLIDFVRRRDPSGVASEIIQAYATGLVEVSNTTTGLNFIRRTRVGSNADTKTAALATIAANRQLRQSASEAVTYTGTIQVPVANVNDFLAGQRFQAKLTHLGLADWTWLRILRRTVSQPQTGTDVGGALEDKYDLLLECSPQEAPCSAATDLNLTATVTVDTARGSGRQWQRPADSNDNNVVTFSQIDNGFGDFVSYLKADLGSDKLVSSFQIINRGDTDAMPSGVHDGNIYYSDDGGTTLHAIPYTFSGAYAAYLTGGATLTFDTPVLARFFYIKASNGGAGAFINRCDIETWAIMGCA
jgi:hypothetical protein